MSYHKESLKEQLVEITWKICTVESWKKVNLRRVAQKAGVSNTAFYRHFKSKNDLKVEIMRKGFHLINKSIKDLNIEGNFASYGANFIRFGVNYPHIYDLMFGDNDLEMSLYPDLEVLSNASFKSNEEIIIKAYNVWASCHGLIGILRRSDVPSKKSKTLHWIEDNLEEYLMKTTFTRKR
jgi:AcrR family transcriptional regulator